MLYFMEKEEELIGKTIAFTHMAQFADRITIATIDGGIFGVVKTYDEDDGWGSQVKVFNKWQMEKYLFEDRYLKEELFKLNIISQNDIDEYRKQKEAERLKKEEEYKKQKEVQERLEYEKLKNKFENTNN